MTTEPGSDELFATLADTSEIGRRARLQRAAQALEEWRVRSQPVPAGDDEPGADHADEDRPPPADERHPEFDPLPPPAPRSA